LSKTSQIYLITGASGAGKTTLVDALKARKHSIIPESGRIIVKEELARHGSALPWLDSIAFGERLVKHTLESLYAQKGNTLPIFADRSLIDNLAWFESIKTKPPKPLIEALAKWPYCEPIFVLHPWEEIYVQDEIRNKSFSQALDEFHAIILQLNILGWEMIEVPKLPLSQRVNFIEDHIA